MTDRLFKIFPGPVKRIKNGGTNHEVQLRRQQHQQQQQQQQQQKQQQQQLCNQCDQTAKLFSSTYVAIENNENVPNGTPFLPK